MIVPVVWISFSIVLCNDGEMPIAIEITIRDLSRFSYSICAVKIPFVLLP